MSKRKPVPQQPVALEAARAVLIEAYKSSGHSAALAHLLGPLRYAFTDVELFALAITDRFARVDPRPHAMFDALDLKAKTAAHEAFVGVIAVAQGLRTLEPDEVRHDRRAFEICVHAVDQALEALAPYVSRADLDLRRLLVDDEPADGDPASGARVH